MLNELGKECTVKSGSRRVAVCERLVCEFQAAESREQTLPTGDARDRPWRAQCSVEVFEAKGGRNARALLGATFEPQPRAELKAVIEHIRDAQPGEGRWVQSPFGRALRCGLPSEYVSGILEGLRKQEAVLRGGVLRVCAGGWDEVDSSHAAFRNASGILAWALLGGEGLTADAVKGWIKAVWS